jgi:hypothetical protein
MRHIVGQRENTFALREAMDTGKIVLVNLAKGRIGEDASALLGAMLVTGIWLAALSRQDIPEEERRDFYLIVDEAHSIATASFADMLSETRKYRLNLTLAHQYLAQLAPELQAAILGNVGKLDFHALRVTYINLVIASGVNPKEAQTLARHATAELTIGLYGRATDERLTQAIDAIAQHVICMASAGEDQEQVVEIPEEAEMPKGGFEPPRLVRHHPLKMACLPIPPLRHAKALSVIA